jgi:hypothetical protein
MRTSREITAKPPHAEVQCDSHAVPWEIGQVALVVAVDAPRAAATGGAAHLASPRPHHHDEPIGLGLHALDCQLGGRGHEGDNVTMRHETSTTSVTPKPTHCRHRCHQECGRTIFNRR